ncbi:MAG: hypothetical protein ACXACP_01210 [Candidatus Hodarchaeales archaeon]
MENRSYYEEFKNWIAKNTYKTGVLVLALACFLSSFIIPIQMGGYFVLIIGIIIVTILIGSMFLLYNTTILFLSVMFQEGLSDIEKTWINVRLRRNLLIILIWVVSTFLTFFMPDNSLGIIAAIFLIALLILFEIAGVEENPFLESRIV